MTKIARKSDGRRIFTDKYKSEQIGRVLAGELTLADLSRKVGIARSLLQRWKKLVIQEVEVDHVANGRETSPSELRAAKHIRELQVMVGKETAGLGLLRTELDVLKKGRRSAGASGR